MGYTKLAIEVPLGALFVNRNFTEHIVGLSRLESEAILDMLYRHSERDDFKCRFKWRPNSIAFWDNRMHHASDDVGLLPAEAVWAPGYYCGDEALSALRSLR